MLSAKFISQTVEMLCACDAFVIAFDESEVNKRSEMEVMVKLSHNEYGLQLRHYQSIELENGKAPTIVEAIIEALQDDGIDYDKKLITAISDVRSNSSIQRRGKLRWSPRWECVRI